MTSANTKRRHGRLATGKNHDNHVSVRMKITDERTGTVVADGELCRTSAAGDVVGAMDNVRKACLKAVQERLRYHGWTETAAPTLWADIASAITKAVP